MKGNPLSKLSIIKPSTRAFIREARRTPGFSLSDFIHGYIYARWPYLYIGIGTGEHPIAKTLKKVKEWFNPNGQRLLSRDQEVEVHANPLVGTHLVHKPSEGTFADSYHGKVVPLKPIKQLVLVGEEIGIPDLEQVIPYKRARSLILKNPDHIAALICPCRSSRENPCLPLDVCLIVGDPFASMVIEQHPKRARWINPAEAVEILEAEDSRGHVHHAFFKDAMLDRFYAICNCCSCCCGAMQAHNNGTPMLASSGYVAKVDVDLCLGCETCIDHCQFGALSMKDNVIDVDTFACMGCGVCIDKCDQGTLILFRDRTKGEPLEISKLLTHAHLGVKK
jgi:ferredoxin